MTMKIIYLFLFFLFNFFLASSNSYGNTNGMSFIPAGKFNIGISTKEIYVDAFYIDKTEVTQKKFKELMGPSIFSFRGENHPAEQITWKKANAYCQKIGKRLPNELEWEKAAKGGTNTKYFWGNEPDATYAWYGGDYDIGHHPVGMKKPNSFGLFDTSGNVWEWTISKGETQSKYSEKKINKRIARGGSFNISSNLITSFSRISLYANSRLFNVGFRCAK
jgi:formylglycine-generating enzyme required for sulfatase activity